MDVGKAVTAYMERMVKEVQGMKMLLLDQYTVGDLADVDAYHLRLVYAVRTARERSIPHRQAREWRARAHGAPAVRRIRASVQLVPPGTV